MREAKDFGEHIAKNRKRVGMTQEVFAAKLGITPQAVSKWENGVGYPDVALFESIAQTLGVSIESLFTQTDSDASRRVPKEHRGLPLIHCFEERGCYSEKEVAAIERDIVRFVDGSTADLSQQVVYNCGAGEIVLYENDAPDPWAVGGPTQLCELLDPFSSLSIAMSFPCDITIVHADSDVARIEATGSPCFIGALRLRNAADTLHISARHHSEHHDSTHNELTVYTDFAVGNTIEMTLNGSGSCRIVPAFDSITATVNGSGTIDGGDAGALTAVINGSGNLTFGDITHTVNCTVNGNGDITLASAAALSVTVNGSGNITVKHLSSSLDAHIHGGGDITAAGEINMLTCEIHGSGELLGKDLVVDQAHIDLQNHAAAHLGHIRWCSTEKIGKHAALYVTKRG